MLLAQSYIHSLHPEAIRFADSFSIKWYGLSYLAGFVVAWLLMRWMAATKRIPLTTVQVGDFVTYAIVGVLVGGRLGYVVFYEPALLTDFSSSFPFWGLLAIHKGGMASHGGMVGVAAAMFVFAIRSRISALSMIDMAAFAAPPGLFFGRLANFINGELKGIPLSATQQATPPWWSIKYPDDVYELDIETVSSIAPQLQNLEATDIYGQIVMESYAGNEALLDALAPHLLARWPSQLFQAASDGPILFAVLAVVWLVARKPGVIGAWFLIAYGILRPLTEQFRTTDTGSLELGSVRTAVVLSVGLVVAGIAMLVICSRRKVDPIGGLLPSRKREALPQEETPRGA